MTQHGRFTLESIELSEIGKLPVVKGLFSGVDAVDFPTVVRFVTLDVHREPLKVFQCYVDWDRIQAERGGGRPGEFQSDVADWDFCDIENEKARFLQVSVFLETEAGPEAVITGYVNVPDLKNATGSLTFEERGLYEDDFQYSGSPFSTCLKTSFKIQ